MSLVTLPCLRSIDSNHAARSIPGVDLEPVGTNGDLPSGWTPDMPLPEGYARDSVSVRASDVQIVKPLSDDWCRVLVEPDEGRYLVPLPQATVVAMVAAALRDR